jgi:hypothetical protein
MELVNTKVRQGFTQLQLTPFAMPVMQLVDRAKAAILRHDAAESIFRTKRDPAAADIPVVADASKPIWVWETLHQALDTPNLVYFPRSYAVRGHQGLTKDEVMHKTHFCAVPGWSVGLIEPIPVMPQQGRGKVIGGRRQLEGTSTPREYLRTLAAPAYGGETGWTPEDFLTHLMVRLDMTGQVSHDRQDANALWLLGSYVPDFGGRWMESLVPVGYWDHRRLYLSAHRSANRLKVCVARSMTRLGV